MGGGFGSWSWTESLAGAAYNWAPGLSTLCADEFAPNVAVDVESAMAAAVRRKQAISAQPANKRQLRTADNLWKGLLARDPGTGRSPRPSALRLRPPGNPAKPQNGGAGYRSEDRYPGTAPGRAKDFRNNPGNARQHSSKQEQAACAWACMLFS